MNKPLRNQILSMIADDQDIRKLGRLDPAVDRRNIRKLKTIIKKYGWPTCELVGWTAAKNMWLIVQHADHDVEFQKKCLALLEKAVKNGEASKEALAFLTDRVLVNTGKKQLYGTQFYLDNGKYGPKPIKNPETLDTRRKKMGLPPFKEYKKHMLKLQKR